MFEHSFIEFPKLGTIEIEGKRHYTTPSGAVYPSITTVLSAFESEGLQRWRARVGEAEANKVSQVAARRGSNVHDICEKYLRNTENPTKDHMPDVAAVFSLMRKSIDRIGKIYAIEQAMYSDEYGIAGRCDLVADYRGQLSVIDFKTSNSDIKSTPDKVRKYFLQCAAYGAMFSERTGEKIDHGVLIVGSLDYGLTTYTSELHKYSHDLKEAIAAYKEKSICVKTSPL